MADPGLVDNVFEVDTRSVCAYRHPAEHNEARACPIRIQETGDTS